MTRRLAVSHNGFLKDGTKYLVEVGGESKDVQRALVVTGGLARQYWPKALSTDPNIRWTNIPIAPDNYEILANQPSISRIDFIDAGTFSYSSDPDDTVDQTTPGTWLASSVTAIEQYIIRGTLVSGTDNWAGSEPLGVWADAFGGVIFGVEQTSQGNAEVVLDVDVAAVDPGQLPTLAPLAGSQVTKRCSFDAIVTDSSNKIAWSTLAWVVTEDRLGSDADCVLTLVHVGTASAVGDNTETGDWHDDAPLAPDPENFTVNTVLVSGDAPTGDLLATNLSMAIDRSWTLTSALGDGAKTCELDVTVSDGVDSVVRRVTMSSERTETGQSNKIIWTSSPATVDALSRAAQSEDAVITLLVDNNGEESATPEPQGSGQSQDWHSEAPAATDPELYEVKLELFAGDAPDTGTIGTYEPLSVDRIWTMTVDGAVNDEKEGWWDVTIRQIGNGPSAVTRQFHVTVTGEA